MGHLKELKTILSGIFRTRPGARLEVFPDTGHASNLEEPERFIRAVDDILGVTS